MGSGKKIPTACFLLAAVILPVFFRNSRYTLNLINLAGIFVILTYSLNFMHGYLGLISIGQAGFFAIGAYVTAGLTMAVGLPYLPALFLAGMASTFAGLLIGFPATRISGRLCARSFQAAVGCVDADSGRLLWSRNVGGVNAIGGDEDGGRA